MLGQNDPDINDQRYSFRDYFTYTIGLNSGATLAAGASTTLTFNIDGESDFFWDKAAIFANVGDDGTTYFENILPSVNCTIIDTNSQRQLMNNPTAVSNIFGTGQIPFILPIRKLFFSKATVKIQVTNVTDDTTYSRLDFSFIGIKAYLR